MSKAAPALVDLRLYVAGTTERSTRAIRALRQICGETAPGCRLEVVDVYQRPNLAREDDVFAVPSVVRRSPGPVRRLIGDLSDRARIRRLLMTPPERA